MTKVKYILPIIAFISASAFSSCIKEDDKPDLSINTPSEYSFSRDGESTVSYGGQQERIVMLNTIGTELSVVNSGGTVDANSLKDMFANQNGAFATQGYTKDLKSKCASDQDRNFYDAMFEITDSISKLQQTAMNGQAGILLKEGQASGYLLNENGLEMRQIILKGLMGSVFYHRAIEEYLGTQINADDNESIVAGKNYTTMEHHYDEAFGYLGIATDLNNADTDPKDQIRGMFWGEYVMKRHSANDNYSMPGLNKQILDAFILGRYAITIKDYGLRNSAIKTISELWEQVCIKNGLAYLEDAKDDVDPAVRLHHLGEAIGFLISMKAHVDGAASNAMFPRVYAQSKIDAALEIVGLNTNLWELSNSDIDNAIALITAN